MGERLTFLHAADFHLGAPLRGIQALSPEWAKRLQTAIVEAFDHLVDVAIARKVAFVVIAGDVFDTDRPSYGDYLHFFDGMRRLQRACIPVYLCTGNHDPYTSWQRDFDQLPPSVHVFDAGSPSYFVYERDGRPLCLLAGTSYYNQTWPQDRSIVEGLHRADVERALRDEVDHVERVPFAVGVVHTGLNLDPLKAPADPTALLGYGLDYWACGHIHMRYRYPSDDNPRIVFPGCIQGRDAKETGPRGCCIVTLEEDCVPQVEDVTCSSVVWQQLKVDVSECRTLSDVEAAITRKMFTANGKAECEEMLVRVILEGMTELHGFLSQPSVREDMRRRLNDGYAAFFCDALMDRTTAPRDVSALAREGLFPALVMHVASSQLEQPDDLVAYLQDEFVKRGMSMPKMAERRVDVLQHEAESLVLDLLAEDRA